MADSLNPQLVYAGADLIPYILDFPGPVDYAGRRYVVAQTQSPQVGSGYIQAFTINAAGINYVAGDHGTVNGGTHSAIYIVLSAPSGNVASLVIVNGGTGYSVASGVGTTATSGTGTGLTINITQTGATLSHIAIFMSTDDGLTWVRQDIGNELTYASNTDGCGFFYPKSGGNTIYLAFAPDPTGSGSGNLNLQTFNMDTNAYGTAISGGPSIDFEDFVFLFRRSDNTFIVLYGHQHTGAGQVMKWIEYNAGWGSPNNVPLVSGTFSIYIAAQMTSHDRVCFLIAELGSGSGDNLLYGSISSTNTATTGIDTGIGWGGNTESLCWGDYEPGSDTAVFPQSTYNSNGAGSTPEGGVIKCANTESSPSFTYETVNITEFLDPANIGLSTRFALSPDGTKGRFWWLQHSLIGIANNKILYADQTVGTTSWSTSTLLWSYIANPPNPPPPIDGVEGLMDVSWTSDNQMGIVLAGWVAVNATNFCDIIYYLSAETGTPSLTLACPVNNTGTVGVPYSGQLIASGGTPPYTYSIIS